MGFQPSTVFLGWFTLCSPWTYVATKNSTSCSPSRTWWYCLVGCFMELCCGTFKYSTSHVAWLRFTKHGIFLEVLGFHHFLYIRLVSEWNTIILVFLVGVSQSSSKRRRNLHVFKCWSTSRIYIPGTCLSSIVSHDPPKQGLFQSKQGSFGFQVYIYISWRLLKSAVLFFYQNLRARTLLLPPPLQEIR